MKPQHPLDKGAAGPTGSRLGPRLALWLCLFIALFPPLHLAMVNGSLGTALTYMVGGPLLIVIAIYGLRRSDERLNNGRQETP